MQILQCDIAKTTPDKQGGYDLLVDMNQVGLKEDQIPAAEIRIDGERFHRAGVVEASGGKPMYWSYWKDGTPAVNLHLLFS